MELQRGGAVIIVGTTRTSLICDQCNADGRKCGRQAPTCRRCLKLGIECTRFRVKYVDNVVQGLSRAGWQVRPKGLVLSSWAQAIEAYPVRPMLRFYLRRYVMPLVLLLPKPLAAKEIMDMCSSLMKKRLLSLATKIPLQIEYINGEIQATLAAATRTFFCRYNPFYPLFSEEAFHARPRSVTLRRVVNQIGLELMPQTGLTRAAIQANNLVPSDLLQLPLTLDTLQCLLLMVYDVQHLNNEEGAPKMILIMDCLPSFLGLHLELRSSCCWLERSLAVHFLHLILYNHSIGQETSRAQLIELQENPSHYHPSFLPRMARLGHFPHLSDRIHFVATKSMFHSFAIVDSLAKELHRSITDKAEAHSFCLSLAKHTRLLKESFMWGWHNLARLAPTSGCHRQLLFQTRLNLAIRFCNNHIELMKLALHIPTSTSKPLAKLPSASTVSWSAQSGLDMAMRCIRLACTVTPNPLGMDCIYNLVPSIAFIVLFTKSMRSDYLSLQKVHAALGLARDYLRRMKHVPYFAMNATAYLALVDFTLHQKKIPLQLKP